MAKNYICPECGGNMVHDYADMYVCEDCNAGASEEFLKSGNDDYIYASRSKPKKIPECCAACGGPYPKCMTSCKIFDD